MRIVRVRVKGEGDLMGFSHLDIEHGKSEDMERTFILSRAGDKISRQAGSHLILGPLIQRTHHVGARRIGGHSRGKP